MLVSLTLVAYLLVASFSLHTLAVVLYLQDRHSPELRFTAMVMVSAGAAVLALASLLWMEISFTVKTTAQAPASVYAQSPAGGSGAEQ